MAAEVVSKAAIHSHTLGYTPKSLGRFPTMAVEKPVEERPVEAK
jgi:hypothetical protein